MTAGFRQWNVPKTETLGEMLRRVRREERWSLADIARDLRIPPAYLAALEENAGALLPGRVYAESFLRSYARFLNLPEKRVLERFRAECQIVAGGQNTPSRIVPPGEKAPDRVWITPMRLRASALALVVLVVLSYIGLQVHRIVAPPVLLVTEPSDSVVTERASVTVVGKTEPETIVAINGQEVDTASDGSFEERVDLKRGMNIVKISAAKKHSKETVVYKKILVEQNGEVSFHP